MPPIVLAVLGVAGGVSLATWIVKEARRVNALLHPEVAKPESGAGERAGPAEDRSASRLRRDETGVYRPE